MTDPRSRRCTERGSSLIAVIGIMAIFAIISITIIGTTMSTLSATTSTRAAVQAQAAAEAGIDTILAALAAKVCLDKTSFEGTNPSFLAAVTYLDSAGDPVECSAADELQIISTGLAADPGIAAGSSQSRETVVAVYALTNDSTGETQASPALYSWSDVHVDKGNLTSAFSTKSLPTVQVGSGHLVQRGYLRSQMDRLPGERHQGAEHDGPGLGRCWLRPRRLGWLYGGEAIHLQRIDSHSDYQ
jgi:hypothetical protein